MLNRLPADRRFRPALWLIACAMLLAAMPGCRAFSGSKGDLEFVSIESDEPARLSTHYQTAIFRPVGANQATVILSDLTTEDLAAGRFGNGVVTCIEMFWRPKAGRTPLDPTSTNSTVRQVLFVDEALGIYRGAGFLSPSSKQGSDAFAGSIVVESIELDNATPGFHDALGRARLTGSFSARRNDALVEAIAVQLNTKATRALGELHYVLGR